MKRMIYLLLMCAMCAMAASAQILKGDMNDDGKIDVVDINGAVSTILGRTPLQYIDALSDPYMVDNSRIAGTWYRTKSDHFSLNADGTTDYAGAETYLYYPYQGRILFFDGNGMLCYHLNVMLLEDGMLVVTRAESPAVYIPLVATMPEQKVTSIQLGQTELHLAPNEYTQLPSVTVLPEDADNKAVTWSNSDESVVKVVGDLVLAAGTGTAVLTCTAQDGSGVTATCMVTVLIRAKDISLNKTSLQLDAGESETLTAALTPANVSTGTVSWKSSDASVAAVDAAGKVTGVNPGQAAVTASTTDGSGLTATCDVTVKPKDQSGQDASGRKYVDLDLPSGTLWATTNVGADNPEDFGLYFAWGETKGYTSNTSDGRSFSWATYKWCNSSYSTITKYSTSTDYWDSSLGTSPDNKTVLDADDDAATANWGSGWQMPSLAQINELCNSSYTTTEWTTMNAVYGRKITSKSNGNSIFLPAAGYRWVSTIESRGHYWSRELSSSYSSRAYYLYLREGTVCYSNDDDRCFGRSVRAVRVSSE